LREKHSKGVVRHPHVHGIGGRCFEKTERRGAARWEPARTKDPIRWRAGEVCRDRGLTHKNLAIRELRRADILPRPSEPLQGGTRAHSRCPCCQVTWEEVYAEIQ